MDGGRGNDFLAGGGGVEVASPGGTSTPGGTGSFDRTGAGGGSFERSGGGGGVLALAVPAFEAGLLRTGGGGGAERPAAGRVPDGFGFLIDSLSSAMRSLRA